MVVGRVLLAIFVLALSAWSQPLKLAVTDIAGLEELQRNFDSFRTTLSKVSGLEFEFYPVTNRTASIEALRAGRLDFAIVGPAEYVVARSRAQVQPIAGLFRPDYFSAIVALSSSSIYDLHDLRGKKIALGDFGSTSYHLAPLQLIANAGLDPKRDVTIVHIDKNVAWQALKRGDVSAVGMNHERFREFRDEPGAYRVVARSADLPPDAIIGRATLPPETVEKFRVALRDHGDILVREILKGARNNKYEGMRFILDLPDGAYNSIRAMYRSLGYPEFDRVLGE